MYLVMMALKWEALELTHPNMQPAHIAEAEGMIGMIPVFANKEDALKWAGEGKEHLVAEIAYSKEVNNE